MNHGMSHRSHAAIHLSDPTYLTQVPPCLHCSAPVSKSTSDPVPVSKSTDGSASLIGRDFLTLKHFTPTEIETLLWTAKDLKVRIKDGEVGLVFCW